MHTFIDLFCGIGGFRLALEERGLRCVLSSEIDLKTQEAYRENFGESPHGDIREIHVHKIPPHDILCGGFPCQSFSVSGKQEGFDSQNGQLFFEIMRIVEHHKPKILLLENVRGITSVNNGRVIAVIDQTLHEAGYRIYRHVLNASFYGIPQARFRVYFVAIRQDLPFVSFLPAPTGEEIYLEDVLEEQVEEWLYIRRDDIIFDQREIATQKAMHPLRIGYFGKKSKEGKLYQHSKIYSPLGHATTVMTDRRGGSTYEIGNRVRCLSLNETRKVMGFPAHHVLSPGRTAAYEQLGNAVIPKMVGHIYDAIVTG
jgi:DNA (cytosine-5)-methyltransferase 1